MTRLTNDSGREPRRRPASLRVAWLTERTWRAMAPIRPLRVAPTRAGLSARRAQFGRAPEQLASGSSLRRAQARWLPVCAEPGRWGRRRGARCTAPLYHATLGSPQRGAGPRRDVEAQSHADGLAVSGQEYVWLEGHQRQVKTSLAGLPADGWRRRRAGAGAKGPRWDAWRWLPRAAPLEADWCRWWWVRRRVSEPAELTACGVCGWQAPPGGSRAGGGQSVDHRKWL